MRPSLSALLAFALLVGSGCDSSSDQATLDARYYVGAWRVVSASDASGDQTGPVDDAFDDLTVAFRSAGTFRLDADFADALNSSGTADVVTEGTYRAQPAVPAVVLTAGGLAATLQAAAVPAGGRDRVRLTAPAGVVNLLLRGLPFQFQGETSVVIERQ